jgi:23S rRNA (uracil1939-C5)-methyltransferase
MKQRKAPRSAVRPRNPRPAQPQAAPRELPQITEPVQIEKPIYGGAFLARVEGKAIFVPLTLPGEQVLIRITDDKGAYATAEAEKILTAAPERTTPVCPHFGACGGCHYQHATYPAQIAFKQAILRETLTRAGVNPPEEIKVLAAEAEAQSWAYRNRIRLAFTADGNPGYRGRRSHAVIPIAECPIAAPLLVSSAAIFADVARRFSPSLRPTELSLFTNADETAMLATVFTSSAEPSQFDGFARAVAEKIPALRGVDLVSEGRSGDRKPSSQPRTVARWGQESINYRASGFEYRVDHGAFFQVNRWLVDGLVEQVCAGYRGQLAWDLFAGVGLFARQLTSRFASVVAVESAPPAVASLEENLRGTTGSAVRASTLEFLRQNSKTKAGIPPDRIVPDLVIVDPPRTGLGPEITTLLGAVAAPALVYVSCDPATLARDLRALLTSGYSLHSVTLADLFPHTFHLETVVHLRRA